MTITDFRKDLFRAVESALNGEHVEVTYKGRTLQLRPTDGHPTSRLERLTKRHWVSSDPAKLLDGMDKMSNEIQQAWKQKWTRRLT